MRGGQSHNKRVSEDLRKNVLAHGGKALGLGMLANLLLVLIKGTTGIVGHSAALVADAVESLSDLLTSLIVYIGLRIAVSPPDDAHPYGHGKAEPMAALIAAMAVFVAGGAIVFQSVQNIVNPHESPAWYTLVVLAAIIIGKEALYRIVKAHSSKIDSTALFGDAVHHRSDAITSLFAFVGIAIALIGGPAWAQADDWAALVAAIIIFSNAGGIFKKAIQELMDAEPAGSLKTDIALIASKVPGVVCVNLSSVRKVGFLWFGELHIAVPAEMSIREGHDIAHAVRDRILADCSVVADIVVHLEPAP